MIPFVLYYENGICLKIEQYGVPSLASAALARAHESGQRAIVVYATSREDLERDSSHCVGGTLDPEDSDALTFPYPEH